MFLTLKDKVWLLDASSIIRESPSILSHGGCLEKIENVFWSIGRLVRARRGVCQPRERPWGLQLKGRLQVFYMVLDLVACVRRL